MIGLDMILDSSTMEQPTESTQFLATVQVMASTTSSIHVSWEIGRDVLPFVEGFQVHFQKVASNYVQYGPMLVSGTKNYNIQNLVADTFYKVCLVMYRNDTVPLRDCVDATTTNWHIPVSIGSSIGAVLALSMIVLMVLLSRCPSVVKWRGKQYKKNQKYDSMSSHYHDDHFEFSETATHGHDEEFASEIDPSEVYACDHLYDKHKLGNSTRNHITIPLGHIQGHSPGHHVKYNGARPKSYIQDQPIQHTCPHHQQQLLYSQEEAAHHNHQLELGAHICSHHGVQGHVCMGESFEVVYETPSKTHDISQDDLNHNRQNPTIMLQDTSQTLTNGHHNADPGQYIGQHAHLSTDAVHADLGHTCGCGNSMDIEMTEIHTKELTNDRNSPSNTHMYDIGMLEENRV